MSMPVEPTSSNQPPMSAPEGANTTGSGYHQFLGMQFTPQQWKQFIQIISQMVSTEIKHNEQTWKETMQRNKEMLEGN